MSKQVWLYWALAGACAATGHLIRSDGLLLLLVGWIVIFYPSPQAGRGITLSKSFTRLLVFTFAYLLIMLPWFVRNLNTIGTVLPAGGTQALWYTTYDDLFSYPPDANAQTFFADGIGLLLQSRWDAFGQNLGTLVAVEGIFILTPFMLLALWRRRRDPFWRGVIWFAIGIHVAFTLAFPFPGVRGGLFHAATALMPFWMALGIVGIDEAVVWIANYRKRWRPATAQWIFTLSALAGIVYFSLMIGFANRVKVHTPELYVALDAYLPPDARIMINDPALMYYFTGRGGTTFPNESSETMLIVARQYHLDYVLLEFVGDAIAVPYNLRLNPDALPAFMREVPHAEFQAGGARLYEFVETP